MAYAPSATANCSKERKTRQSKSNKWKERIDILYLNLTKLCARHGKFDLTHRAATIVGRVARLRAIKAALIGQARFPLSPI